MRLIDADALLRAYDEAHEGPPGKARKLIEDAPTVVEWVSVEDRQPRWPGEYIVKYHPCYWDSVWLNETHIGMDSFRGKTTWAKHKYQRVTHWMPTSALLGGDAECD